MYFQVTYIQLNYNYLNQIPDSIGPDWAINGEARTQLVGIKISLTCGENSAHYSSTATSSCWLIKWARWIVDGNSDPSDNNTDSCIRGSRRYIARFPGNSGGPQNLQGPGVFKLAAQENPRTTWGRGHIGEFFTKVAGLIKEH